MRPIAIFRHSPTEGPGYFAIFLERRGIPWKLIPLDAGAKVPVNADDFSGLCFMGGPMSVNDPLPWIEPVCALIRAADATGVPVIGHCLGGQLISKALGGVVTRNPVKEIGWGLVSANPSPTVTEWLGTHSDTTVFHWHGETFSLPPGAQPLLGSAACPNQAYALGQHLAMQCHVEMLPEMIRTWCENWREEITAHDPLPPSVQMPEQMLAEVDLHLPGMRALADQLYTAWLKGLRA